ncbi:MAG: sel1 repeat family protein [Pseudomonadales bacterium]|nr:sel1 repeat family protein [Pseudomonadales bacterium]
MKRLTSLTSAAKRGNADAQCQLAAILATGSGMPRDDAQAFHWYRQAANRDHPEATYNLAMMYWNGEGTRRSEARAQKLLEKAAKLGSVDAHEYLAELKLRTQPAAPDKAALHLLHAIVAGSSRAAVLLADWLHGERITKDAVTEGLRLLAKSKKSRNPQRVRRPK